MIMRKFKSLAALGPAILTWLLFWPGTGRAADSPPQIQPSVTFQHTAVDVGATNIFTVVATGDALSYQWQLDGQDLPGETNQSCIRTNARPADEGDYTVVLTNAFGSVTSAPARLWVVPRCTDFIYSNYTNTAGVRLPYFYSAPTNEPPAGKYPLLFLFHGYPGGETMMTNATPGGPGYLDLPGLKTSVSYRRQAADPVIVVWPVRRAGDEYGSWTPEYLTLASELLDRLILEFNVDTNRLYVAGGRRA